MEIETTITFGRSPDLFSVWTNDPKWVRRILKVGVKPTKLGKREDPEPSSYWFEVPADVLHLSIGIRKSRKPKSEDELRALRENIKQCHDAARLRRQGS